LTPVALAALGAVMGLLAWWAYPATNEQPTPAYTFLDLMTKAPIDKIYLRIYQTSPTLAEMRFQFQLPLGERAPQPGTSAEQLIMMPPEGTQFQHCPAPACQFAPGTPSVSRWTKRLSFTYRVDGRWVADADFAVRAGDFGVVYNGITASAVMPQVSYQGSAVPPTLLTGYQFPLASSYDWSSFPPALAGSSYAIWQEFLSRGVTTSRVAVGIDHAAQSSADFMTFLAGALVGVAGAAILSALQEALHAFD
jgi:hypothetical protein